jgi:hypothetical protein
MKLLLVESEPGLATAIEDRLSAGGHDVVSCADDLGGPCRGVADHAECPLHEHVDLTILARRPNDDRSLGEMGAVCSDQHRVPVVEVDPDDPAPVLDGLDATVALARRRVEAEDAAAARRELQRAGVDADVRIEVRRTAARVEAVAHLPARWATSTQRAALADRVRHALRTRDPFVRVIDVSVVESAAVAG